MKIILYPDQLFSEKENEGISDFETRLKKNVGIIPKFFKDLMTEYPELWSRTYITLKRAEGYENLHLLERQGIVEILKHLKEPIKEFKIPKQRKGGVVRLYFAHKKSNSNIVYILSAEVKHKTNPDPNKIRQAIENYYKACI